MHRACFLRLPAQQRGPHARSSLSRRPRRWSATGSIYLSNVRLVFLADKPDASGARSKGAPRSASDSDSHQPTITHLPPTLICPSPKSPWHALSPPTHTGLVGFDIPLVYICPGDKLNQPIFGCNNLAGRVWPAVDGGGPAGGLPPHDWKVLFKNGGIGTLWPLYYALTQRARREGAMAKLAAAAPGKVQEEVQQLAHAAFVDPNDPSTVYLTQPVPDSAKLQEQPKYAPNYGKDEKYQPM